MDSKYGKPMWNVHDNIVKEKKNSAENFVRNYPNCTLWIQSVYIMKILCVYVGIYLSHKTERINTGKKYKLNC